MGDVLRALCRRRSGASRSHAFTSPRGCPKLSAGASPAPLRAPLRRQRRRPKTLFPFATNTPPLALPTPPFPHASRRVHACASARRFRTARCAAWASMPAYLRHSAGPTPFAAAGAAAAGPAGRTLSCAHARGPCRPLPATPGDLHARGQPRRRRGLPRNSARVETATVCCISLVASYMHTSRFHTACQAEKCGATGTSSRTEEKF